MLAIHIRQVHHIRADPLLRGPLSKIDLSDFRCAMVLCDEQWVDADLDETNGIDNLDEPSVLRLDSLAMVVQVRASTFHRHARLHPYTMRLHCRSETQDTCSLLLLLMLLLLMLLLLLLMYESMQEMHAVAICAMKLLAITIAQVAGCLLHVLLCSSTSASCLKTRHCHRST